MKKFLLSLIIIICLIFGGLVYFIKNFDADSYRTVIVNQLENILQRKVELNHIALSWRSGPALKLEGFVVYPTLDGNHPPLIKVSSAYAAINSLPFAQGTLQIGSVIIDRPEIFLVRDRKGEMRGFDNKIQKNTGQDAGQAEKSIALSFLVQAIHVNKAVLKYVDEGDRENKHLTIQDVDLTLRNLSLGQKVPFEGKFSLLSTHQNIHFEGHFAWMASKKMGVIQDFSLNTQLEKLSMDQILRSYPKVADPGLSLGGDVQISSQVIYLDDTMLNDLSIQFSLKRGRVSDRKTSMRIVDNIEAESTILGSAFTLKKLSATVGSGSIAGSANVRDIYRGGILEYNLTATQIKVEKLIPPNPDAKGSFEGKFFLTSKGSMDLFAGNNMLNTIQGSGQLGVDNGILKGMNVTKEVIGSLSMVPGLSRKLEESLTQEYRDRLNQPDTIFEPIQLFYNIRGGSILFDQFVVKAEDFLLSGQGGIRLPAYVSIHTMYHMDPELSLGMTRSVKELTYISDEQGQIGIPIRIEGAHPNVRIIPDVQYLVSKLAVSTATQLLQGLIGPKDNNQPQSGTDEDGQSKDTTNDQNPQGDALTSLINQFF